MLDILSGGLGLGVLVAALVLAGVLEVADERASVAARGAAVGTRRRLLAAGRLLLPALVVLALVATVVRIFVVVR